MASTVLQKIARLSVGALAVGGLLAGLATPAAAAPAGCIVRDGTATAGVNIGGKPTRWEYGNSPSIGVRFDSCADVFKVYVGGYSGITHHNIRYSYFAPLKHEGQVEVGPKPGGYYISASPHLLPPGHKQAITFSVQACKRGGFLQSSSCTRWSPPVTVNVTR